MLPALIRKSHEARLNHSPEVVVWGSGNPRREFLHVDDLADAAVFLMLHYDEPEIVNVGVGTDITIRELARVDLQRVTGFKGAWCLIRRSRTARHKSCWMFRGFTAWAGAPTFAWKKALPARIAGFASNILANPELSQLRRLSTIRQPTNNKGRIYKNHTRVR